MTESIPFIDLAAQRRRLEPAIRRAIDAVLAHGRYILGPEVAELEAALAKRTGVRHAVACANGTDALLLCLRALGAGPGDAVFVPGFTFAATAEVVVLAGATPVFVDVEQTSFNIDPASLAAAVEATARAGRLRPTGIIPVDLFGQPADYGAIGDVADRHNLWIVEDAAQSFGATLLGKPCGSFGIAGATSFFPAKPLGCYGDGGAVFTDDDRIAETARSLRMHGEGTDRYQHVAVGTNSRLDTIQAAILLEKLKVFDDELNLRNQVAARYTAALAPHVATPTIALQATSAWAQYTVRAPNRGFLMEQLASAGIPTAIYYPRTLPQQPAYHGFPVAPGGLPNAEAMIGDVFSLPMHPYLDFETQDRIVTALLDGLAARGAA